jgi:hypothetical protein
MLIADFGQYIEDIRDEIAECRILGNQEYLTVGQELSVQTEILGLDIPYGYWKQDKVVDFFILIPHNSLEDRAERV